MNPVSIEKINEGSVNEDAAIALPGLAAVSDGAGGAGLYAEQWSRYLVDNLPLSPIVFFEELDRWLGSIWESFYSTCEVMARAAGGMVLSKFYDEGSYATLAAVWRLSAEECRWMAYGDSVVFHYNWERHSLEHSFTSLADFDKPPHLINDKDELLREGFSSGLFHTDKYSAVFVTSDALAHYIMMMYELSYRERFADELRLALESRSRNSQYIKNAMKLRKLRFEPDILQRLFTTMLCKRDFTRHLSLKVRDNLLSVDDYSLARL